MDKVQHFEIPAEDMNRARKFYEDAFGWKTAAWPIPGGEYIGVYTGPVDEKNMWKEPGFINGGMIKKNDSEFPIASPVITIVVEDIQDAVTRVEAAGGTMLRDVTEIADIGKSAYFKDSEGNVTGMWEDTGMKK